MQCNCDRLYVSLSIQTRICSFICELHALHFLSNNANLNIKHGHESHTNIHFFITFQPLHSLGPVLQTTLKILRDPHGLTNVPGKCTIKTQVESFQKYSAFETQFILNIYQILMEFRIYEFRSAFKNMIFILLKMFLYSKFLTIITTLTLC